MMITMFIICYRDPMCQIHTQWWHFSALIGYCSFDDVLSQKYGQVIINDDHHVHNLLKGPHVPNSYAVGTLFGVDGFYCSFDDVSSQKYGQVIINYNIFKERCVATHQANRQLLGITLRWWWMNERICTLVHVLLTLSGDCSEAIIHPSHHTGRPQAALFPGYNAVPLVSKVNPWFCPCFTTNTWSEVFNIEEFAVWNKQMKTNLKY